MDHRKHSPPHPELAAFEVYTARFRRAIEPPLVILEEAMNGPHWYLEVIAVDPDLQRTGIGSALLDAIGDRADAGGLPVGLLTYQPENLPFYDALGYSIISEGSVEGLDRWGLRRACGS